MIVGCTVPTQNGGNVSTFFRGTEENYGLNDRHWGRDLKPSSCRSRTVPRRSLGRAVEFVLKSLGPGVSHYVHRWLMSHVSQVTLVSNTGTCVKDSRCVVWLAHTTALNSSGVRCPTVAAVPFGSDKLNVKAVSGP